ncbi:MAG: divalent-cation tolerance protein CutA [Acidobacteria bacterium]|nr:divalent-cation tolerance protein CutA [Acidobacteriota bacterium]MBI3280442.1 divalent-cation tolerance protein CutA [Acidobacteriota bacterium]
MTDKIVVFSNCASGEEAERVARALVEQRLAACVNIIPGVRSIYHWQGAIEEAGEWTLLIKTTRSRFERLEAALRRIHSYQVPEVIAVPVIAGAHSYLEWMDRELDADG